MNPLDWNCDRRAVSFPRVTEKTSSKLHQFSTLLSTRLRVLCCGRALPLHLIRDSVIFAVRLHVERVGRHFKLLFGIFRYLAVFRLQITGITTITKEPLKSLVNNHNATRIYLTTSLAPQALPRACPYLLSQWLGLVATSKTKCAQSS